MSPTQWKSALPQQVAEQRARQAIANAPQQNLQLLFSGAQLVFNYDRAKEYKRQAMADVQSLAGCAEAVASTAASKVFGNPRQMLIDFVMDALPGIDEVEQIIEELLPNFLVEVAAAAPYIGPCIHVARGSTNLVMAARSGVHLYDVKKSAAQITPGAPLRAVEAMQVVIEREIAKEVLRGSRLIASGAAEITVMAASLGADYATPIIGAANALMSLVQNVYLHWRDRKELRTANGLLADPTGVKLEVFETCPILGCFLVGMVPTSDLLNMIATQIGASPDWMSQVETIVKKHIHPLQKRAAGLIQSSRFYLKSPNEHLFATHFNKATLRAVDGGGPKAMINLVRNKKYNFGRQVSNAKYYVRSKATTGAKRGLQKLGVMNAPAKGA
ncbi:MAG TPA: hypothetical protein VFW98_12385 [Gemmatimonadaceae bacterium]|nr:hypothetical protein [Gemmatimonadaceae bacterium]